ncbi:MAG: DUF58 domain-containing protein [Cyclobacteriaceae bacterium]|nr:DUF58 domain-containing protein [Cyclobacteriaceae bacterium]
MQKNHPTNRGPKVVRKIKNVYPANRLYLVFGAIAFLFALSYYFHPLFYLSLGVFWLSLAIILIDLLLLFKKEEGIKVSRECAIRFSNGETNAIMYSLRSGLPFSLRIKVFDELPKQFQIRKYLVKSSLKGFAEKTFTIHVKPVERGEYYFGNLHIFIQSPVMLFSRRIIFTLGKTVKVYPAFSRLREYELMTFSQLKSAYGIKKIRRVGHSMEFDQIKDYVEGDDVRTINWKATARRQQVMVNTFQDEKSQNIYSVIDTGRVMKISFEGMTLLDYSINAALAISHISLKKDDKTGVFTFGSGQGAHLPAGRMNRQMSSIMEFLYRIQTNFAESDFEKLYIQIQNQIRQHSLIFLFTNFESVQALYRQLPYLRKINSTHRLVVIFFENTEITEFLKQDVRDIKGTYQQIIAGQFKREKHLIVNTLQRYGIQSILTPPALLSIQVINKYLELKSRNII